MRTELSDSPFSIVGDRYIVIVKALPQLTLNNGVVIDDQEFALFFSHTVTESSPATSPVTATAGNLIVTTVPTPSLLCTSIRQPFSRTYSRLSNAPMPYLLPFEALNGLNNSSRMNAGDIPEPLSDTSITASRPLRPQANFHKSVIADGIKGIIYDMRHRRTKPFFIRDNHDALFIAIEFQPRAGV